MARTKDLAPYTENTYGSPCYTAMGASLRVLLLGCHQGCYLRLLPTSRWATEVIHRPGKSYSFLMSALFIPNYYWKAARSESGGTWMLGHAGQGGPSVTTLRGGFCPLSGRTFIFSFAFTPAPNCPCPPTIIRFLFSEFSHWLVSSVPSNLGMPKAFRHLEYPGPHRALRDKAEFPSWPKRKY